MFSDKLKSQAEFSSSEGEKEVNRKKNRYKDILPCEFIRSGSISSQAVASVSHIY